MGEDPLAFFRADKVAQGKAMTCAPSNQSHPLGPGHLLRVFHPQCVPLVARDAALDHGETPRHHEALQAARQQHETRTLHAQEVLRAGVERRLSRGASL